MSSSRLNTSYLLVICEKPSAAKKIAEALNYHSAGKSIISKSYCFYPVVDRKGIKYIVSYALGHLYGLSEQSWTTKNGIKLSPQWVPLSQKKSNDPKLKSLSFKINKILKEINEISKNTSGFIHACDYDQEGEVIGYNILELACQNKYFRSQRAKFSSLTDEEITKSFNNLLKPNKNLADAGLSRHLIDFIYGINLSIALTSSIKVSSKDNEPKNRPYILSIGRVQGPTLAFVVDREKEISLHVPIPYWNIEAEFEKNNQVFKAYYYPSKIETKSLANKIIDECKDQVGKIADIANQKTSVSPPHPFNLGELQREAFKKFRFNPSYTLSLAEKLYLDALISYPRTSSQELPSTINYRKIMQRLSNLKNALFNENYSTKDNKIKAYSEINNILSNKKTLKPNNGKESDPAHPAIYPTGEQPRRKLQESELKLFDLIIRRFFSTFGDPALTQEIVVTITIKNKHIFKSEEKKILSEGWIALYRPYVDLSNFINQNILPSLKKDDTVKNINIKSIEKETQPPPRYNQSSLLQKMEKEKIGTKATRAEIINTLFKRNYLTNSISTTPISTFLLENSDKDDKTTKDSIGQQIQSANPSIKISNTQSSIKSDSFKNTLSTKNQQAPESPALNPKNNQKKYFQDRRPGIRSTPVGIAIINAMRKYVPSIVSVDLTRSMEEKLEQIEIGKIPSTNIIKDAKEEVKKAIRSFEQNKIEIGNQIKNALLISSSAQSPDSKFTSSSASTESSSHTPHAPSSQSPSSLTASSPPGTIPPSSSSSSPSLSGSKSTKNGFLKITVLGKCPICKQGELVIKTSKSKKRFAGCSLYSTNSCNATASLPQKGTIKSTLKYCQICNWPIVSGTGYNYKKRYQWQFCINMQCPSKKEIKKTENKDKKTN